MILVTSPVQHTVQTMTLTQIDKWKLMPAEMYHSCCKVANKSLNLFPKVKTFHNPTFYFLYNSIHFSQNNIEKHMVSTTLSKLFWHLFLQIMSYDSKIIN